MHKMVSIGFNIINKRLITYVSLLNTNFNRALIISNNLEVYSLLLLKLGCSKELVFVVLLFL